MINLEAKKRDIFGKKLKPLREKGFIPAELYGPGVDNLHLIIEEKPFKQVFKNAGESTIIKLKVDEKEYNVLIHDISYNYLNDKINHIDFYAVRMDKKIKTLIPLVFKNEAPAVKEKGGFLIKVLEELEIEALPKDLPHHLEIDLSSLKNIGDTITVADLNLKEGIKPLVDKNTIIVSVTEIKEEEIETEQKEAEQEQQVGKQTETESSQKSSE